MFRKLTSVHKGCVRSYKRNKKKSYNKFPGDILAYHTEKISEKCRTIDQRGLEMSRYSLILLLTKLKYISTPFIIYN